jgi:DNA-binding HxlR family transcriptional regulator
MSLTMSSTMASNQGFLHSRDHANCAAELALKLMRGRWKVLTSQLRELENSEVLTRTVHPEVPPRVEYALTGKGLELISVLEELHAWGTQNRVHRSHPRPIEAPTAVMPS